MLLGGRKRTWVCAIDRNQWWSWRGVPLLRPSVDGLAAQGVRRFVFLVDHMADMIHEALGDAPVEGADSPVPSISFVSPSGLKTQRIWPLIWRKRLPISVTGSDRKRTNGT